MELNLLNKKITVIGAGRSGIAASLLAAKKGAKVLLSESGQNNLEPKIFNQLLEANIVTEFGNHTDNVFDCDFIVVSPGVPLDSAVIQKARKIGISIFGELEFASLFAKGKIVGITGTNGKTTTTALTHHLLSNCGFKTFIGGNIGEAFSNFVDKTTDDSITVLEVSSYQLDTIESFHPNVSVILNITPDHLERYENDFSKYISSKFRITLNQKENDLFIYNLDDINITQNIKDGSFIKKSFSIYDQNSASIFLSGESIFIKNYQRNLQVSLQKPLKVIDTRDLQLVGVHNYYNTMAGILVATYFDCDLEAIRMSLKSFRGVEHRQEVVRVLKGVTFINDSKATNVRSTYYALKSFDPPIILILGGREKDNDYTEIFELVKSKVKFIIAIGETKEKIYNVFSSFKNVIKCDSLQEALEMAYENSSANDIVLFSPACKSFDMFRDFEHRGKTFKEIVNALE